MKFSKKQQSQINSFLDDFESLLLREAELQHYKDKTRHRPGSGVVELKSGLLVPELEESVLVVHHEFRKFVLDTLAKLLKEARKNVDNKLFGFAERPIYEYITTWVFLFIHPEVKESYRDKLRSLMLAGHYKYVSDDTTELGRYLQSSEVRLERKDIKALGNRTQQEYFDRIHKIIVKMQRSFAPDLYQSVLENLLDFASILSFQHMRIHANVWSLLEMLGDYPRSDRHRLLLLFYARQVLEYFSVSKATGAQALTKQFDEIMEDLRLNRDKIMS